MLYQYKPLDDPENEIRLVVIQPGSFGDPIHIKFKLRSLKNDRPRYEALSYAWGSSESPYAVDVDGSFSSLKDRLRLKQSSKKEKRPPEEATAVSGSHSKIPITQNLKVALQYLRYKSVKRIMWIDALCIDQISTQEKNKQVAIMGQVFATAERVVIWLGSENDDSDKAFDMVEQVGRCVEVDWYKQKIRAADSCPEEEQHWGDITLDLPFRHGALDPWLNLLERPYFNRVWVRQEIGLAKYATVHCGAREVEWNDFRKLVACVHLKYLITDCVSTGRWPSINKARASSYDLCFYSGGLLSYSQLRHNLGYAECRDPRDKIFAVLALLCDNDHLLDIQPNYSQNPEALYIQVALRVITQQYSLKLLESCVLSSRTLALPSWVPDWSTPMPQATRLETFWSACGFITTKISIPNAGSIIATGLAVRTVRETRADIRGKPDAINVLRTATNSKTSNNSERRWTELFCSSCLNFKIADYYMPHDGRYPTLETYIEAIELMQSSTSDFESLEQETDLPLEAICFHASQEWDGLSVFVCEDGHFGLSCASVQDGDLVSVLLGCHFPVLLRPAPQWSQDGNQTYEVVGPAVVTGLMMGEAIYGDKLPLHWQAVSHDESNEDSHLTDGRPCGLYDPETNVLRTNPAEILTEMGIKVESYEWHPHRLEVLPETLRAAGIPLQEFVIA